MFTQGMNVTRLIWPDDSDVSMNHAEVKSMNIEMEQGQSSLVPWVKVVSDTEGVWLHNIAHLASIKID